MIKYLIMVSSIFFMGCISYKENYNLIIKPYLPINQCDSLGNVNSYLVTKFKKNNRKKMKDIEISIFKVNNGILDSRYLVFDLATMKLKEQGTVIGYDNFIIKCQSFAVKEAGGLCSDCYYKKFSFTKYSKEGYPIKEFYDSTAYEKEKVSKYFYPNTSIVKEIRYNDSTAYYYRNGRLKGFKINLYDRILKQIIIYKDTLSGKEYDW